MKNLSTLTIEFIDYCKFSKNLTENTTLAYRQDLNNFLEYFKSQDNIAHITSEHIEQFTRYLNEQKQLKSRTIKRKIACLLVFFNWLISNNIIKNNPVLHAKIQLKQPKLLPKIISEQDLMILIKNQKELINTVSFIDKNYTTLISILLMSCTGIRVGELVRIQLSDIESCYTKIKIHGKGRRERYVYITNKTLLTLFEKYTQSRFEYHSKNTNLLVNSRGNPITEQVIRLRITKLSKSLLGKKITPHMFRHTAATLLINQGVDIRFVQKLLGHQSITTTEIYTHVSDQNLIRVLNAANHLEGVL